ncbi:MAG TPA: amidohydrolase family protein [Gemmatimonadaceae bacterium]|nr:amidohydrolase family protein [Gemmatimonadaceae bacterium]
MRHPFRTFLSLIVLASIASPDTARSQEPQAIAFVGASVIPMDREHVLENHTVIVRGDRIVEVGPAASVRVPAGAQRVEARGKFIIPGLAEMHGHVPPPNAPAQLIENTLFLYVANGITTVRGMLGAPGQLELRERTRRGEVIGPTLYLAGPSFNGNSVNAPAQAEQMVREQKAAGWDLLKVHPGLTRQEFDAMARTAKEVGIDFAGHVPQEVGLLHALEMGQRTFDHLDGYMEYLNGGEGPIPEERLRDAARRTKAANAWVVPTMVLWETLMGVPELEELTAFPELRYMPENTVTQWTNAHRNRLANPQMNREVGRLMAENRKRLLGVMQKEGVGILMGTDAPQQFSVPGFSLHREMALMVEAGMTPYEVLTSGTLAVGRYFADKDRFGTIAAGQRADLILLDANPLTDIGNVARSSGVMVRGRWLPKAELDRRLGEIAR